MSATLSHHRARVAASESALAGELWYLFLDKVLWLYQRRWAFYLVSVALLAVVLVWCIANPAFAAPPGSIIDPFTVDAPPKTLISYAPGNMNYLAFGRYFGVVEYPLPPLSVGGPSLANLTFMRGISALIMGLASTGFWVFGILFAFAVQFGNFIHTLVYVGNKWFGSVWTSLRDTAGSGDNSFLGTGVTIFGFIIVVMAFWILLFLLKKGLSIFTGRGGAGRMSIGQLLGAIAMFAALVGMGASSAATDDNRVKPETAGKVVTFGDYPVFSYGWTMGGLYVAIDTITGIVSAGVSAMDGATQKAIDGIDFGSGSANSTGAAGTCNDYIANMHDVFKGGQAAPSPAASVAVQMDNLYVRTVRLLHREAAYGPGAAGDNVWCRMADMQSQVSPGMLALSAMGIKNGVVNKPSNAVYANIIQDYVNEDGSWKQGGIAGMGISFGLVSESPRGSLSYLFAACSWGRDGAGPSVAPGWDNVLMISATSGSSDWKKLGAQDVNDASFSCRANTVASMSRKADSNPIEALVNVIGDWMAGGKENRTQVAKWDIGYIDPVSETLGFFSFGVIPENMPNRAEAFKEFPGFYPQSYLSHMHASSGNTAALTSGVISVIAVFVIVKNLAPIAIAAVIGAIFALVAGLILPLVMAMGSIPVSGMLKPFFMVSATIIGSKFVAGLFGTLISIAMLLIGVIDSIFRIISGSMKMDSWPFVSYVLTVIAIFLGLHMFRFVMTKIFAINMNSFREAVSSATKMSGAAFAGALGFNNPWVSGNPDSAFNPLSKDKGPKRPGPIDNLKDKAAGAAKGQMDKGKEKLGAAASNAMNSLLGRGAKPDIPGAGVPTDKAGTDLMLRDGKNKVATTGDPSIPGTPLGDKKQAELTAAKMDPKASPAAIVSGVGGLTNGGAAKPELNATMTERANALLGTGLSDNELKEIAGGSVAKDRGMTEADLIKMTEGEDGVWRMPGAPAVPENSIRPSDKQARSEWDALVAMTDEPDEPFDALSGLREVSEAERAITQASMFSLGTPQLTESGELVPYKPIDAEVYEPSHFGPDTETPGSELVSVEGLGAIPMLDLVQTPMTSIPDDSGIGVTLGNIETLLATLSLPEIAKAMEDLAKSGVQQLPSDIGADMSDAVREALEDVDSRGLVGGHSDTGIQPDSDRMRNLDLMNVSVEGMSQSVIRDLADRISESLPSAASTDEPTLTESERLEQLSGLAREYANQQVGGSEPITESSLRQFSESIIEAAGDRTVAPALVESASDPASYMANELASLISQSSEAQTRVLNDLAQNFNRMAGKVESGSRDQSYLTKELIREVRSVYGKLEDIEDMQDYR